MNAPRKKAALKSIEGMNASDAAYALANDPAKYTDAEQLEIMQAAGHLADGEPPATAFQVAPKTNTPAPDPILAEVQRFNYSGEQMQGETFRDYNRIAAKLLLDKKYYFEVYKVHPVKSPRYEDVPNSPIDIVGIRILDDKPLKTTLIPAKMMLEYNGQLREGKKGDFFTIDGGHFHNVSGSGAFGEYYLLKKDQ